MSIAYGEWHANQSVTIGVEQPDGPAQMTHAHTLWGRAGPFIPILIRAVT
jgi:hypothetical protein